MKKIVLAGSVTVFIMILVGLIIGFYLMGYKSPMMTVIERGFAAESGQQPEMLVGEIIGSIIDGISSNWMVFGIIVGVSLLTSVLTGGSTIVSFISVFLPMFILLTVANLFFFPIVTDVTATDPAGITIGPLGVILAFVFNALLMLTVIEFITGRP